jgi:hypothetical protein
LSECANHLQSREFIELHKISNPKPADGAPAAMLAEGVIPEAAKPATPLRREHI